jgi:hypothetical protein
VQNVVHVNSLGGSRNIIKGMKGTGVIKEVKIME